MSLLVFIPSPNKERTVRASRCVRASREIRRRGKEKGYIVIYMGGRTVYSVLYKDKYHNANKDKDIFLLKLEVLEQGELGRQKYEQGIE